MHPFSALSIPEDHVGIHWFGQSSFAFKTPAGTVIQVDPYFPHDRPADRFMHPDPPLDEATLPTDLVLLTHNHGDHTCLESLLRIHEAFPGCRFIGPEESVENMRQGGLPERLLETIAAGDTRRHGDVGIDIVWAKPPEGAPEDGIKAPDVQHLGYVLDIDGVVVYISGDPINTFGAHDELLSPIAALQPDVGILTTHPDEGEFPFFDGCVEIAFKLGLRAVIPAHYQCFVQRNYDPDVLEALFPEDGPMLVTVPYNKSVVYPD